MANLEPEPSAVLTSAPPADARGPHARAELAAQPSPILSVRGVSKRFDKTPVLHAIDLDAHRGEFLTLLGPSGCGKTTLLRIIAGLEVADSGQVFIGGEEMSRRPASRRPVNTVFQSYALFPHLTVAGNVEFGLRSRKMDDAEIARRVQPAMQMLQIDTLAKRYPHQLSGGQKQRVALARALVNEPTLLLLDEPMSALDAKLRGEVQVELRRLQQRLGKTFILVTHDQDEAMTVSDRIAVMKNGRIEQIDRPHVVYERPRSRFVAEFLGAANLIPAHRNGHYHQMGLETPFGTLTVDEAPAWQTGTLAIRPERVRVCDAPPAVNGLQVRVNDWVYRGDHIDVWVDPQGWHAGYAGDAAADGGRGLRVKVPPSMSVERQQPLWVQLPPEHLEVLVD